VKENAIYVKDEGIPSGKDALHFTWRSAIVNEGRDQTVVFSRANSSAQQYRLFQ
jgi:hypothetical protein